jgi:hypothetical protein
VAAPPRPEASSPQRPRPQTGPDAARRRAPRRARLVIKRLDPWSVLKVAFIYSLAAWLTLLVAVSILYAVLDGLGVFRALRSFFGDVGSSSPVHYLAFEPIFVVTLIVGGVMAVMATALLTLGAFLYNLCGDLVGGIEVTLTEPR